MPPMGGAPQEGADPMGADPMAGGPNAEMDPMAGGPDPMMGGEDGAPQDNSFGGNFDPGVEANEETDPEKFIQQLTGKLSQSLKKYNDENPDDESGLNKYVAGMVATQAAKGLTEPEKNEIIKKINTGEVDDEESEDISDEEMGKEEDAEAPEQEMPMESKKYRFSKKQIMESILTMQEPREKEKKQDVNKSNKVKRDVRNKPWNAPEFK